MKLRALSSDEIKTLTARKGVNITTIENFISNIGGIDSDKALANMLAEANRYSWNAATLCTITAGIMKACKNRP